MSDTTSHPGRRPLRVLFGDRYGLALFLVVLTVTMVYWRGAFFINDNETLVRTLDALSDGRLWIEPATGESVFDAPGAEVRDGLVYGRNYGQLAVSLPALWALRAIDAVANVRVAMTALWHLVALVLVAHVSSLLDHHTTDWNGDWLAVAGSLLAVVSFLVNLWLATPLVDPQLELLALQLTALVATAFVAVFVYRLVAHQTTARLGFLAGFTAVLVLPVGFWASIPKRHVFSVLACMAILYAFARSRDPDATRTLPAVGTVPVYRAGAYALVGFLTWIHAAEGLFVFLVLVAVDLPTAPSNDRRTLAIVAVVFALSLVPTVLTNWLVTGHPARPPRTLGGGGFAAPASADASPSNSPSIFDQLLNTVDIFPVSVVVFLVSNISELLVESITNVTSGSTAYHTFLRSAGVTFEKGQAEFSGTNLSMLESAPILAGLAGVVAAVAVRVRPSDVSRDRIRRLVGRIDPTATLAVGLVLGFFAIYLSRLPLYVQVNVRYLLPVYPLGLYLLVRTNLVQSLVTDHTGALYWSYGGGVLLGGQLVFATVAGQRLAVAEAAQLHALVALACAGLLAVLVFVSHFDERGRSPAAVALGLAAASGTIFLVLAGVYYFAFTGEYVLPVVERLVGLLPRL